MNNRYLFVYSASEIRYWDFTGSKLVEMKDDREIGFKLDPNSKPQQKILDVKGGANAEKIVIIVQTSEQVKTILEWDLKRNAEIGSLDILPTSGDFEIIFDSQG